jgi:nucleotide-binding universal stress UspA family protein
MEEFRHVVVATDGSPGAARALDAALRVVGPLKASLTVLSVIEPESTPSGTAEDVERLKRTMAGCCEEFCNRARAAGVRHVKPVLEVGLAYSRILHYCETYGADLLVLGARGASTLAPDLGTVCSHVARFATCPVLIVK